MTAEPPAATDEIDHWIAGLSYARVEKHFFQLSQINRRQRLTVAKLVKSKVTFVRF
jgi:hypothetical protein